MAHLQMNTVLQKMKQLKLHTRECVVSVRKVNALLREVDPTVVKLSRIEAVVNGVKTLGAFSALGFFLQSSSVMHRLGIGTSSGSVATIIVVALCLYSFLSRIARDIFNYRSDMFHQKIYIFLDEHLARKNMTLDMGRLMDPEFVALSKVALRGTHSVIRIFNGQNSIISEICGGLVGLGITLSISKVLFFVSLLAVTPRVLYVFFIEKKHRDMHAANDLSERQQYSYSEPLTSARQIVQTKMFQHTEYLFKKYVGGFVDILQRKRTLSRIELKLLIAINVVQVSIVTATLVYIRAQYLQGAFTIGSIVLFIGGAGAFLESLNNFSVSIGSFYGDHKQYQSFEQFMETEPLIDETDAHDVVFTTTPNIVFDHVSFAYPTNPDDIVLSECSFGIPAGSKIALVGENGAGKTTLMKVLAKFYVPTSGTVRIGGYDITAVTQKSVLETIVSCTQDSTIPDIPIIEAITGSDTPDLQRLQIAAKLARVDVFVSKLKQGYHTRIGGGWNDGQSFSGGQEQRLKLAAAFYRLLDPSVTIGIFDEPMSSCDIETKNSFYEAVNTFAAFSNKTIIVVIHDHAFLDRFPRVIEICNHGVTKDITDSERIREFREYMLQRPPAEIAVDTDVVIETEVCEVH